MNVYEAAQERLRFIFDHFDNICVSFSGGKDSGVLLNLTLDYAEKTERLTDISVMHIDYEAQYQMTTDYVEEVKHSLPAGVKFYHICMPIKAQCSTSMFQDHWKPWSVAERDIWTRELPKDSVNIDNHQFDFWNGNMWDYAFQDKFGVWLHKQRNAKRTACLVGIRTQESLNRWRAIHSDRNYRTFMGRQYSRQMASDVFNFYPIYDWITEDIWTANAKFGYSYNKLYDLYYQAGVPLDAMRVASPFNDAAQDSLKLYRVIEPHTWGKLVSRVNGVNFTGIYGGTTAMGWKSITLPKGHTWKSYCEFLLSTLPTDVRARYHAKLDTSIKFWKERGGVLGSDTVDKLKKRNINITVGNKTNYKTDKLPVRMDYLDDIDISEFREIPTYKRMCICIMKNDHFCKYMGFSQTKYEMEKRKNAIKKYKEIL